MQGTHCHDAKSPAGLPSIVILCVQPRGLQCQIMKYRKNVGQSVTDNFMTTQMRVSRVAG